LSVEELLEEGQSFEPKPSAASKMPPSRTWLKFTRNSSRRTMCLRIPGERLGRGRRSFQPRGARNQTCIPKGRFCTCLSGPVPPPRIPAQSPAVGPARANTVRRVPKGGTPKWQRIHRSLGSIRIEQPYRMPSTFCIKRGIGRRISRFCRPTTGLQGFRARETQQGGGGSGGGSGNRRGGWRHIGLVVSIQTVAIPVLAPLAAAGPVVAALAGAGAGGALGWIAGLLAGLPLSEYVAKRYAGRIRRGGILLSVHCDGPEWRKRAKKTLKDTGARDISSASETAADFGTTDKPTERASGVIAHRGETPARSRSNA